MVPARGILIFYFCLSHAVSNSHFGCRSPFVGWVRRGFLRRNPPGHGSWPMGCATIHPSCANPRSKMRIAAFPHLSLTKSGILQEGGKKEWLSPAPVFLLFSVKTASRPSAGILPMQLLFLLLPRRRPSKRRDRHPIP